MQHDKRLRDYKQAQMKGKVVLVRVDHNVVKKGVVVDPYRIEATIPTLMNIALKGGLPVLMTHVGRPKDKKTNRIVINQGDSVGPVVDYLMRRLDLRIEVPQYDFPKEGGLKGLGIEAVESVKRLKEGKCDMVYLPNTRWFEGEEAKDERKDIFAKELGELGEVFVNDAFGSWQAHVSTYYITKHLPSYAGSLIQAEVSNLYKLYEAKRPFVVVIAGNKYDTKIGPLNALYDLADYIILGGVIYNAYLGAKYNLTISGLSDEDKQLAKDLVSKDKDKGKVIELNCLVENTSSDPKDVNSAHMITIQQAIDKKNLGEILDIHASSFSEKRITDILLDAKTIFINAVMGYMPYYTQGTKAMFELVYKNKQADIFLAGGDTLNEFKNLCPGEYIKASSDPKTCFFTGGGAVLTALEQGSPFGLRPVEAVSE